MTTKEKVIRRLIDGGYVKFGDFTLKDGRQMGVQINFRGLVNEPALQKDISILLEELVSKDEIIYRNKYSVYGVPYSGLQIAHTYSLMSDVPQIICRADEERTKISHGGEYLAIFDDVIITGRSMVDTLKRVHPSTSVGVYVLLDLREDPTEDIGGREICSLFTLSDFMKNQVEDTIRRLIQKKMSNICLAVDDFDLDRVIQAIEDLGDKIVMIKIQTELYSDLSRWTDFQSIAKKKEVVILNDRKYCEIAHGFELQFGNGPAEDAITMVPLSGPGQLESFKKVKEDGQAVFLVLEMGNVGSLIGPEYKRNVISLAHKYRQEVAGFITRGTTPSNFLNIITGVHHERNYDDDDQCYIRPDVAMKNGGDLAIIGRGIMEAWSDDGVHIKVCENYRKQMWDIYYPRKL